MAVLARVFGVSTVTLALGMAPAVAGAQEPPEASVVTDVPRVRAGSQRLKTLIDEAVAPQTAEEPQLDDAALALVDGGQRGERLVERDQVPAALVGRCRDRRRT